MKQFENLTPPEKEFIPFTRNFELERCNNGITRYLSGQVHFKSEEEKEVEIHLYERLTFIDAYFKTSNPTPKQIAIFQSMIDEIDITDDSDYYKCE